MKKLLLGIGLFLSIGATAQSINGVNLAEINKEFVTLVGVNKLMSSKMILAVDYGQEMNIFKAKQTSVILDKDGKPVVLNSMTDGLNFMFENGYEFVSNYILTTGNGAVYYYILRKKH